MIIEIRTVLIKLNVPTDLFIHSPRIFIESIAPVKQFMICSLNSETL